MKTTKGKIIWLTILLLIPVAILSWTALMYHPEEIKGNIRLAKSFNGHKDGVWTVAFSPDNKFLASGSVDSTIIVRDVSTGNPVCVLKHPAGVTGLEYGKDGRYIVSSSYDGMVRLWSVKDQQLVKEFKGAEGTVWAVAFSAHGRYIAAAGEDRTVRIWDITNGSLVHELKGHQLNVWSIKFSPDGHQLASASFDNRVIIWNVEEGEPVRTLEGHTEAVVALAFSPDGKTLASTSDDKTVKLWNTEEGKLLQTLEGGDEHVQAVAFSPDGKKLIVGGRDKNMLGELVQNFFGDSYHNKGVSMRLWDIGSGKLLQTFSYHANDVNDLAWSRNGEWIASASADKRVGLWSAVDNAGK